jgi:DNA-binding MarR family transcriptional regulator
MRRSPLHLLHQAEQAADQLFLAGALGFVTPRQFAVLIAVSASEGGNLTHVIERTGIDRSTASELVRRMTRMGLVQKRRSRRDTRSFVLRLTKEGRRRLDSAPRPSPKISMPLCSVVCRRIGGSPSSRRCRRSSPSSKSSREGHGEMNGYDKSP